MGIDHVSVLFGRDTLRNEFPLVAVGTAVCVSCRRGYGEAHARLSLYKALASGLSAALFVIHPVARKIFIGISRRGDVYAGLLLYIIACVALAWATRLIINKMKKG